MPHSPATKVSSWRTRYPGSLPNTRATNEGSSNGQAVMVELLIDGIWTDLSILGLVLSENGVSVNTRGRPGENSVSGPATVDFTAKNLTADFSFANPASIYWGKVVLGTRVRISVPRGNDKSYRFQGELSMIPQVSDISGQYSVVDFEAAGRLRRLGQNNAPLHSPIYREIIPTITNPLAIGGLLRGYWPMEDGSGSLSLASAYPGGSVMTFTGSGNLASYTGFACSDALPNVNGSIFRAAVPRYSPVNGGSGTDDIAEVCFLLSAPSGITSGAVICEFTFVTGTAKYTATLTYSSTDHVTLSYTDDTGTLTGTSGSVAMTVAGVLQMVEIIVHTSHGFASSQTDLLLYRQTTSEATHDFIAGPVGVGPFSTNRIESVTINRTATASDYYVGHVSVFEINAGLYTINGVGFASLAAYKGELADVRFDRLCSEQGEVHEVLGTYGLGVLSSGIFAPDASSNSQAEGVAMGPQTIDTFLNLLRQCESSDDGIIYEMTSGFGTGYRTRRDLQNQAAVLTLTHSAHELSAPLTPLVDDSFVLNDVTVTRTGGTSYEAVQTTGPRSVSAAPAGMGPYPTSYELSLQYDGQAGSEATWAVHKGTVNEPRYKQVQVNLNSIELAGTTKRNTILDVVAGDRMVITGLPVRYGYEDISQLALGFTEAIDQFQHIITINCMPESPYRTAKVSSAIAATDDMANTGGSHLSGGIGTTDTSLTVVTDGFYVWADSATYSSDFPFDIMMDGERMTVTACSGTTSPQTFTVTRSVNSVIKPHNDQAMVTLYAAKAVSL